MSTHLSWLQHCCNSFYSIKFYPPTHKIVSPRNLNKIEVKNTHTQNLREIMKSSISPLISTKNYIYIKNLKLVRKLKRKSKILCVCQTLHGLIFSLSQLTDIIQGYKILFHVNFIVFFLIFFFFFNVPRYSSLYCCRSAFKLFERREITLALSWENYRDYIHTNTLNSLNCKKFSLKIKKKHTRYIHSHVQQTCHDCRLNWFFDNVISSVCVYFCNCISTLKYKF